VVTNNATSSGYNANATRMPGAAKAGSHWTGSTRATVPNAIADSDALYVVIEATVPGTQRPAARPSYGTIVSGIASQSAIYFTKTTDGGATWTPLTRIDPQAAGNQFYPDIDANAGRLHVVW
jgi:hypothetical protein